MSITESIDDFDQSALFFRSVLGLVPGESTRDHRSLRSHPQLVGERSRRSRAHHLEHHPAAAGDWAPGVSSPQLVAFATDDAIACAKVMRERGAPILQMPGNYYDDLDARLSLPAELIESLREHSILYDRDEQGEFLHFFTEMLGSRVFFEVVQRIDGYAGFGDPPAFRCAWPRTAVNGFACWRARRPSPRPSIGTTTRSPISPR